MKFQKAAGVYTNYIEWKNWSKEEFGVVKPGSFFYFNQIFQKKVREKSTILEIGFGNGELLGFFKGKGHHIIGVEIIDDLTGRARNAGCVAYTGAVWDIAELRPQEFDLIVAFDVLEHMTYEHLNMFFLWIRKHLKDQGKLYLKFPEGASPFGLANQNSDFTHMSCLTKAKIQALCETSDLQILSYTDDLLSSNKLCSFGLLGKLVLLMLQGYASVLKLVVKTLLFPLTTSLRLGTNSIAVIGINLKLAEATNC